MKYYITGANGQLGYDLKRVLEASGHDVLATDVNDVDITSKNDVVSSITNYHPDVIIHCAAWTAVDNAEDEVEKCTSVNVDGTKNITYAAKEVGAKLIYISTDYVFDGTKDGIYEVNDLTNPLSVYGSTKLDGERIVAEYERHFIVRISWVFGINGNNFVKSMINLGKQRDALSIVADQIGSPTYTYDLSHLLANMSLSDKFGTYHATNEGYCSWADFAREIFKICNLDVNVSDIPTSEYPTKAIRPLNSKLSKKSLVENGFELMPTWQESLENYIEELKKTEEI